jgi:hypothetical protein
MPLQDTVLQTIATASAGDEIYLPGNIADTYAAGTLNLGWGLAAFKDDTTNAPLTAVAGFAAATAANFAGFVKRDQYAQNTAGGDHVIAVGDSVAVLRVGEIWAVALEPLTVAANGVLINVIVDGPDVTNIGKLAPGPIAGYTMLDITALVNLKSNTTGADEVIRVSLLEK